MKIPGRCRIVSLKRQLYLELLKLLKDRAEDESALRPECCSQKSQIGLRD